jgi:hypothetical protein
MKQVLLATVALAFLGLSVPSVMAAGPGSCGRGKVWNPDTKKCVPKPRDDDGSHSY